MVRVLGGWVVLRVKLFRLLRRLATQVWGDGGRTGVQAPEEHRLKTAIPA